MHNELHNYSFLHRSLEAGIYLRLLCKTTCSFALSDLVERSWKGLSETVPALGSSMIANGVGPCAKQENSCSEYLVIGHSLRD